MNIIFDTVIYHGHCPDGVSGLWCAHKYKSNFEKISMRAGIDPVFDTIDKNIIFIDVCPSLNYILENIQYAQSIIILDHHKSAYDIYIKNKVMLDQIKNLKIIFDMSRSGAQIAWDFFFENQPRSWFIDYVGDRDLWKWELPYSKEISSAFDFNNYFVNEDLSKLDLLNDYDEQDKYELIKIGTIINEYQYKLIKVEANCSSEAEIIINNELYNVRLGHIIGSMVSDLGSVLANQPLSNGQLPDFGVVWNYNVDTQTWFISLRGNDMSPDLSQIAKQFGGGGHAKAAGFRIEYPTTLTDIFRIFSI